MTRQGKEVPRIIDVLLAELHKEWERSGRTDAVIVVSRNRATLLKQLIIWNISKNGKYMEREDLELQEGIAISKNNFILLRIAKKLSKFELEQDHGKVDTNVLLELDKEEVQLYRRFIEVL